MLSYIEAVDRLVDAALKYVGCPYVWRGKGRVLWSPTGAIAHPWTSPVFDCSGLWMRALKDAGGPDWTLTHAAETIRGEGEREYPPGAYGTFHFFGRSPAKATHIEMSLDHGLFLGSYGGDETTLYPKPGAGVGVHRLKRNDFIEAVRLPLEQLLK